MTVFIQNILESGKNKFALTQLTVFLKIEEDLILSLFFFKKPAGSKIGILTTFILPSTVSFIFSSNTGYLGFFAVKTVISQSFLIK